MTHDQVLWQILSALAVILTVIATRLQGHREHKQGLKVTAEKIEAVQETTAAKIDAVQEAVNGTTATLAARSEQLATTLAAVGAPVPPPGPTPVTPAPLPPEEQT